MRACGQTLSYFTYTYCLHWILLYSLTTDRTLSVLCVDGHAWRSLYPVWYVFTFILLIILHYWLLYLHVHTTPSSNSHGHAYIPYIRQTRTLIYTILFTRVRVHTFALYVTCIGNAGTFFFLFVFFYWFFFFFICSLFVRYFCLSVTYVRNVRYSRHYLIRAKIYFYRYTHVQRRNFYTVYFFFFFGFF